MSVGSSISDIEPNNEQESYADLILNYLHQMDVEYIFGVPGGAIEPLYNAMHKSGANNGVQSVVARHESGAAFMADGYARETGRIGVCCSTTGPGSTNLITGVATAFADNIPMLIITAQIPLPKFGRRALQDSSCAAIDTVSMFNHCTKHSTLISHHEQLEAKLVSALMMAKAEPAGPVHISIPSDILRSVVTNRDSTTSRILGGLYTLTDQSAIDKMAFELKNVDTIALYIGDGCKGASVEIMHFAELINAQFVSSPMGKRWVDETHPLYRGVFGFAGHDSANTLLKDKSNKLELVIAIGAAFEELATRGWSDELMNEKLIHVDSKMEHFTRSQMAKLHVCGDLPTIFRILNDKINNTQHYRDKKWGGISQPTSININGCRTSLANEHKCKNGNNEQPIKPQKLFNHLSLAIPTNTRMFVDAGNSWAWSIQYYQRPEFNGKFHMAMGFGAMAWAIGAVIGSSAATKGKHPHVCITGDGSYLMSAQELTVAKQLELPIIFMVMNDSVLGMVMHGQRLGGAAETGFELGQVNFTAIAEAIGLEGITINSMGDLTKVNYSRLFAKKAPTLLDLHIDKEEVPPITDRVKGISINGQSATPGG